jgi:hypothetical protein
VRVQGAIRSYAAGFSSEGKFGLYKNENGYRLLLEKDFNWETNKSYTIKIAAKGNTLNVSIDGKEFISFADNDSPYLYGCIGFSVRNGGHCAYRSIKVK